MKYKLLTLAPLGTWRQAPKPQSGRRKIHWSEFSLGTAVTLAGRARKCTDPTSPPSYPPNTNPYKMLLQLATYRPSAHILKLHSLTQ